MPPWEKYQQQAAQGPWTKYAAQAPVASTGGGASGSWDDAPYASLSPEALTGAMNQRQGHDVIAEAVNQGAAGINEGIAGLLGAPVDLTTGAINLGVTGVNAATGSEIPTISDPVGGGQDMRAAIDPFITAQDPQSAVGRYSRSVGRDAGGAAIPVLAGAGRSSQVAQALVNAGKSVVGSGVAAQGARDVLPDSPVAEIIAGLVGGAAPFARMPAKAPQAPSIDDLRAQATDLYETGRQRAPVGPSDVSDLQTRMMSELQANSRVTPTGRITADGNVKKFLDVLEDYQGQPMSPAEMQNMRTFLQDAAASADAGERRLGTLLLGKFDEWRGQHVPEFRQGDALYGRVKRAQDIDARVEKAENRAATSGTGGNSVNAMRQNLRQILDDPRKQRGYSQEELSAMRAIVRGDRTTNALRLMGRLSPTSGAAPLMANLAGIGLNPQIAIPAMGLAAAAKGGAEVLTGRQIDLLSALIRGGGSPSAAAREMPSGLIEALIGSTVSRE